MKLKSLLLTASGDSAAASPPSPYSISPESVIADASPSFSDSQLSSSDSNSSIQSHVSLETLPSVPSLEKLELSGEPSVSVVAVDSLKPCSDGTVNFLAVYENFLYAAVGNKVDVYEVTERENTLVDSFNAEKLCSGAVKSIAFFYGKIYTAHQDCKIRVWVLNDQKQHKQIATLPTLSDRLQRFVLPENYVKVRRHKKKLWVEHHDVVSGLAVSQNGDSLSSVSWDRSVKFWNGRNFHCLQSINRAHDDAINAVAISNNGFIYTGSADRRIKVWRKIGKKHGMVSTLEKHKSAVNALSLTPNGSVLFSGSCDRSILVWERVLHGDAHMTARGALRGHRKAILCLINVNDFLFSGSADHTLRIWRRRVDGNYSCLSVLEGHRSPVRSLAAESRHGDGGDSDVKVFSGSFDGEIKVWRVVACRVDFPIKIN